MEEIEMDESIKKFKQRRDARLKKRLDDEWITIKGTHVMVDDDKNITKGPERLKSGANRAVPAKNLPPKESTPLRNGSRVVSEVKGSGTEGEQKGRAYPVPKDMSVGAMKKAYDRAVDGGKDPTDVLKGYTRGSEVGARITIGGDKGDSYTKVGENKWKPDNAHSARSASGYDDDRELALKIGNAFLNRENVNADKPDKKPSERKPRPRTKLEVMKQSKENYAKVQEEIKGMKPGLARDVKEKLILPWIKGTDWMGGLSDRKFTQITNNMPYKMQEIYDEFQKQMMKY